MRELLAVSYSDSENSADPEWNFALPEARSRSRLAPMMASKSLITDLSDEDLDRVHGGDRAFVPERAKRSRLDAFQGERDALAHADAHRAEREAAGAAGKLGRRGGDQPRSRGPQRVT